MIRIELEPLEQKDIVDYLKYAKAMKEKEPDPEKDDKQHFTTKFYDINRIDQLIDAILGQVERDILLQRTAYKEMISDREPTTTIAKRHKKDIKKKREKK